jgi:hypothetical protein
MRFLKGKISDRIQLRPPNLQHGIWVIKNHLEEKQINYKAMDADQRYGGAKRQYPAHSIPIDTLTLI